MAVKDPQWLDGQSVLITTSAATTGNLWLDGQSWDLLEYVAAVSGISFLLLEHSLDGRLLGGGCGRMAA